MIPHESSSAMTINKAQEQILEHVGMHLPKPKFTHRILDIALTRLTSQENIKMFCIANIFNQNIIV